MDRIRRRAQLWRRSGLDFRRFAQQTTWWKLLQALFWIPFLVIPFYLFIVLPQRRQTQAASTMDARLVVGDEIIMTSGIYGTIVRLDDETVDLEIAPGTVITIARRAVGRMVADLPQPQSQTNAQLDDVSDIEPTGEEG